jgi:hypothetical protein
MTIHTITPEGFQEVARQLQTKTTIDYNAHIVGAWCAELEAYLDRYPTHDRAEVEIPAHVRGFGIHPTDHVTIPASMFYVGHVTL